jgi:hypothetical protein
MGPCHGVHVLHFLRNHEEGPAAEGTLHNHTPGLQRAQQYIAECNWGLGGRGKGCTWGRGCTKGCSLLLLVGVLALGWGGWDSKLQPPYVCASPYISHTPAASLCLLALPPSLGVPLTPLPPSCPCLPQVAPPTQPRPEPPMAT